MSDYTRVYNFTVKDSLPTGDSGKVIKGTEIDVELNAVSSSIASKADTNSPTFTGTPLAPTASAGTNNTQLATTAFVMQNGLNPSGTGIGVRTGPAATTYRSVAAGTGISVANGDGVAGNPTITNTGVLSVNGEDGALTVAASAGITATTTTDTVTLTPTSGYNSYGVRTVSTSSPTGGSNGDIWYQIN
jgi:hypothetical protein